MKYLLKFLIALLATLIVVPFGTVISNLYLYIYHFSSEDVDWKFDYTVSDKVKTSGGPVRHVYQNWFYWAFKIIK